MLSWWSPPVRNEFVLPHAISIRWQTIIVILSNNSLVLCEYRWRECESVLIMRLRDVDSIKRMAGVSRCVELCTSLLSGIIRNLVEFDIRVYPVKVYPVHLYLSGCLKFKYSESSSSSFIFETSISSTQLGLYVCPVMKPLHISLNTAHSGCIPSSSMSSFTHTLQVFLPLLFPHHIFWTLHKMYGTRHILFHVHSTMNVLVEKKNLGSSGHI